VVVGSTVVVGTVVVGSGGGSVTVVVALVVVVVSSLVVVVSTAVVVVSGTGGATVVVVEVGAGSLVVLAAVGGGTVVGSAVEVGCSTDEMATSGAVGSPCCAPARPNAPIAPETVTGAEDGAVAVVVVAVVVGQGSKPWRGSVPAASCSEVTTARATKVATRMPSMVQPAAGVMRRL
jgi:hypothetical protein